MSYEAALVLLEQMGEAFRDQDLWYQTNFLGVSGGTD